MRATIMYGAKDVKVRDVPDATLVQATDALGQVSRSSICGSDLWPCREPERNERGRRMGHELAGLESGADRRLKSAPATSPGVHTTSSTGTARPEPRR